MHAHHYAADLLIGTQVGLVAQHYCGALVLWVVHQQLKVLLKPEIARTRTAPIQTNI